MNSRVATGTAAIPEFSSRMESCKLHVVHDPQSASASMTASTPRSFSITSPGARFVKHPIQDQTKEAIEARAETALGEIVARLTCDIFFVYTHNWIDEQFQLTTQDRRVAAKISYTHRF